MPGPAGCPDPETLDSFVKGGLGADQRAETERHLDSCPTCRRAAVRLITQLSQSGPPAPTATAGTMPVSAGTLPLPTGVAAGELNRGDKVGRHIILGRLGAGGMGTVYAAYDTTLERKIALKFLSKGKAAAPDAARLVAEASAMARLSHPNVVTVHDVGLHEGQPYLAMEYVQGQTLAQWRRERPRTAREILDVMAAVARGLEAAHAAGLVHRDVKPQNVLVSGQRVQVTDFGLSVRTDGGPIASTAGTPAYMAPEQFLGQPTTRATDVFGFSVTLYELLYDQPPFGTPTTELRERVLAGKVTPPPAGKRVPRQVQRLVLAGLSVDPAARPAAMGEIAATLLEDPARRRRWLAAGTLAAGAVALAFWGGGYLQSDPARSCRAGASIMDGVWSSAIRLQAGRNHEQGTAAPAWQSLVRRFDEYAAAWRDMFTDNCKAAFTDRRISGELYDLRRDCLDGHRASFAAVVQSLAGASATQIQSVAASSLPPIAECGITERLSARPLPADPTARAKVARINEALAQVDASRALGDFARARTLATSATADAKQLGYQPLEARAMNKLAAVELRGIKLTGNSPGAPSSQAADRAVALLEQAIVVAEGGRDDASRAEAATQLTQAHRDAGRLPDAERWANQASAIVQRIGDPPLYRSALEYARGWVFYDRQDRKAAEAAFGRAYTLREKLLGPRAPEVLASKTSTCHTKPRDQRIQCLREAMALALTIAGPRHPDLASIKANLAYVLVDDAAKRDEACKLATEAIEVERAAVERNDIGLLRAQLALAQCHRDQGRPDDARRVYLDAIKYATHPTGLRGDLLADYAAFLSMQGDRVQAMAYRRKSIDDYEVVYGATHHKTIETRQRNADDLRRQGQLREALKEADAAIAVCDKENARPLTYPELFEVKGLTLSDLNQLELAYQALRRSVELHDEIKTPAWNRAFAVVALGELELKMGKLEPAIAHLGEVMQVFTLESDPMYHAVAAFAQATAIAKQGRASWPRACEVARRALAGFSQPAGGPTTAEVAVARKFLAAHRCTSTS